jgi:catalase
MATSPVRYADSVETIAPDEEKTFTELAEVMVKMSGVLNDHYRHAVRPVHAKSHGLLKAELTVNDGLPGELRQGLFGNPATYGAIVRFSTIPGDILADSVSTPRGMAVKIVGANSAGPVLPEHAPSGTQDFVCVNAKSFGIPNAAEFIKIQKLLLKNLDDPEIVKKAISNIARGTRAALGLIGIHADALANFGHPETNLLGETFGTCAALRYGDYVAKLAIIPASESLKALYNKHVPVNFHFSGLRDAVVEFFQTNTAVWDVCVQLNTDLKKMPVEDPTVPWPESDSPYRPVAKLIAKPQNAYSPTRRVFVDEILSFNPWQCLAAHRPLGNIMRARQKSYAATSSYRHNMNGRSMAEPREIGELPD